jgi:hypothetical protein
MLTTSYPKSERRNFVVQGKIPENNPEIFPGPPVSVRKLKDFALKVNDRLGAPAVPKWTHSGRLLGQAAYIETPAASPPPKGPRDMPGISALPKG